MRALAAGGGSKWLRGGVHHRRARGAFAPHRPLGVCSRTPKGARQPHTVYSTPESLRAVVRPPAGPDAPSWAPTSHNPEPAERPLTHR